MIVIIDYHVGNLMSVQNAFLKLGMDVVVSRDHDVIRQVLKGLFCRESELFQWRWNI